MNDIPQVGPVDPEKKTSEIVAGAAPDEPNDPKGTCIFNGQEYGAGSKICSAGRLLYCNGVQWSDQGSC